MDILKPNYITIGKLCFRSLESWQNESESRRLREKTEEEAIDMMRASKCDDLCEDNDDNCDLNIERLKDSRLLLTVEVPKCFRGLIFGSKGQTKNRITSNTNTNIEIPRENQDGPLRIYGSSERDLRAARKRILDLIDSARQKTEFTHFIAITCENGDVKEKFIAFKNEVLSHCATSNGICDQLFQHPNRLHLTFGILVLLDERERKEAESLLQRVVREFAYNEDKVKMRFQGLEYMNDDPAEVDVLYAKMKQVEGCVDIQKLADNVVKEFSKIKLMKNVKSESVKFHLTLMNSKFKSRVENWNEENTSTTKYRRETFDARQVIREFGDYYFGECTVNDIAILRHDAYDDNGCYKVTARIKL
ncbi:activating signal cointegrator 1 complex subunit 1-like protein [Dinothrombium tinctorium]|uniref:Activating signal cointegrator 1 complex subunit 1-like protein n=1 Tax=Dinothrombium tinctorium TaxID=1965070 RepID=A0A3S3P0Y9_9ACAR|nr:activating signal cointegrator 1 complex subunit 1-like protein [Dinothrombium tinctorium]